MASAMLGPLPERRMLTVHEMQEYAEVMAAAQVGRKGRWLHRIAKNGLRNLIRNPGPYRWWHNNGE